MAMTITENSRTENILVCEIPDFEIRKEMNWQFITILRKEGINLMLIGNYKKSVKITITRFLKHYLCGTENKYISIEVQFLSRTCRRKKPFFNWRMATGIKIKISRRSGTFVLRIMHFPIGEKMMANKQIKNHFIPNARKKQTEKNKTVKWSGIFLVEIVWFSN